MKILAQGDAGAMVTKLVLTKDNPMGDAVFGIDNTFASGRWTPACCGRTPRRPPATGPTPSPSIRQHRLTAVDYGDVCVNVDHA